MIRRRIQTLFTLLVTALALHGVALGQAATEPTRIVILPFDAEGAVSSYQLGLPGALQHALNQIPGVYVPPTGDAALMANKAADTGQDVHPLLVRVFGAQAIVTGRVTAGGAGVVAELNVDMGGVTQPIQVQGAGPAELTSNAAEAVALAVMPNVSSESLASVRVAAEQTPSVASLGPTGLAASGLPGSRPDQMNTASQLDSGSGWVAAEYARTLALAGALDEAEAQALRASELAPNDAEVQAMVGVVLQAAGAEGALAAYQRALTVNPGHAIALAGRASVNSVSDEPTADPNTDLEAAIAAYPRFVDAYIRLANRQSDLQRAVQTLRRAEGHSPESALLRGSVMQRLIDSGDVNGALAYLRQAVSDPVAQSASMFSLVRLLPPSASNGAKEILAQGRQLYPASIDLQLTEAEFLLQEDDPAAARALLEPLYAANPGNVTVANLLAVAQAESGDVDGARETFESLRDLGFDVEIALAELYLALGRAGGALEILEQQVAAQPDDGYVQALYGTALMRLGRLAEGEEVLEDALQLEGGQELAARSLELLRQQRELTGGDVAFSELAGVAFQQGLSALDQQNYMAAADAFGRSRAEQETGLAAFYQGYARQLLGQSRAAATDYQVALETFEDSDIVLNNMGYAQLELGRFDLALEYLRRAIAANPDNAQAHLNLGVAYYAVQRFDDAIREFAEAGRLDPSLAPTTETLIDDVRQRLGQP